MGQALESFAFWLRGTPISEAIRVFPWLWPVCEILHFFGLSLLIGVAGFFDLRLLGFMRRVPLDAAWSLMPWARIGFALSAITGITFFIGAPDQYVTNLAFFFKVLFLLIAGANALFFELAYGKQVAASRAGDHTPTAYRTIAAVSLVSWLFVVYWGRMLPFIGNAF
jgi:hypothetical protein